MQVADRSMTADARDFFFAIGAVCGDRCRKIGVTMSARRLGHLQIAPRDLYRLVKIIERKVVRVPESVRRLCRVLADRVVRRVTVVARRHTLVTRFLPTGVLLIHDVAVCAGDRVIAHVRIALCVHKREQSDADRRAECDADESKF